MTEARAMQTAMPEHVANFAWATGWDVELLCYSGPGVAWRAPNLESPEWRQAVMDGLADRGWRILCGWSEAEGSELRVAWIFQAKEKVEVSQLMKYVISAKTLNAALNAACTQAREDV